MPRLIGYIVDSAHIPENQTMRVAAHDVPRVVIADSQIREYLSCVLAYRDHDVLVVPAKSGNSMHVCLKIYHGSKGGIYHIPPMLELYNAQQLKLLETISEGSLPANPLAKVQQVMRFLRERSSLQRIPQVCSLEMKLRYILAPPSQKHL
ncbi:hypothetical protein HYV80_04270 [Candidatus Woesearchaeota archaeon]|nr:hypothetical protein [Candidatus Woesearchaeota archaeon]